MAKLTKADLRPVSSPCATGSGFGSSQKGLTRISNGAASRTIKRPDAPLHPQTRDESRVERQRARANGAWFSRDLAVKARSALDRRKP